jgi:hypothetical protein
MSGRRSIRARSTHTIAEPEQRRATHRRWVRKKDKARIGWEVEPPERADAFASMAATDHGVRKNHARAADRVEIIGRRAPQAVHRLQRRPTRARTTSRRHRLIDTRAPAPSTRRPRSPRPTRRSGPGESASPAAPTSPDPSCASTVPPRCPPRTRSAPVPNTPANGIVVLNGTRSNVERFVERRIVPVSPTTNMPLASPQIAFSVSCTPPSLLERSVVHACPSFVLLPMKPSVPTTNSSGPEVPHTPFSTRNIGDGSCRERLSAVRRLEHRAARAHDERVARRRDSTPRSASTGPATTTCSTSRPDRCSSAPATPSPPPRPRPPCRPRRTRCSCPCPSASETPARTARPTGTPATCRTPCPPSRSSTRWGSSVGVHT